ncbi:hypothetical protein KOR42_28720 [Thalassoglobus neptunius]|uniref:DUF6798 domain-containing protein n=1 Tax=Thalassoglobus neptunius TaxID=1938619 RepID=A0A5C5WZ92_9PLAN|nr:DUF6798 domain-containing protein [Thalassoglobus neptunius]TWT55245.1 hypothetical protein KOR42_28720 [Thalassoglobus neptunius]
MPSVETTARSNSEQRALAWADWLTGAVIYGVLLCVSFLRVPIPGVNEPHYLSKAKHFWQPEWCAGDFFLDSSNPHLVFYWVFGWLSQLLTLEQAAIVVRVVGYLPLAVGWTLLGKRVTGSGIASVLSLGVFLTFHSLGNWSGEWLVGGMESKVIAYGFLFGAMASAMSLRIVASALLAGLAISFHPVVGVWGTLSAAAATLCWVVLFGRSQIRNSPIPVSRWFLAAIVFVVAALPGLWSAASIVLQTDPNDSLMATHLQVAHRLAHHLDPMTFPKSSHRYFTMLVLAWAVFIVLQPTRDEAIRWWRFIGFWALAFALIGVAIAWGPRPVKSMPGYEWRIALLKFYPFRLADILIPVSISFSIAELVRRETSDRFRSNVWANALCVCIASVLVSVAVWMPGSDRNPSGMSAEVRANWIDVARWIDEHTPEDSLVYSLENQWAVKWFANRPEYVNYKDCPQDAESLLEWNRRLWMIANWKKAATKDMLITADELQDLHDRTGIDEIIFGKYWKVDVDANYRNKSFRVYRIPTDGHASGPTQSPNPED